MRILLISPLRDLDPACGDIVHTEALLVSPPDGVVYETYAAAIERGALIEHAKASALKSAWRSGEGRWRETWMTVLAKIVNLFRAARWLFWEPFRIFSVRPGEYDLVHVHAFNCGFRTIDCPVVMGCDLPTRHLYTDARGYSSPRVRCIELCDRFFAAILGVNLTSYRLPQIRRVIVPSKDTSEWYLQRGLATEDMIDVAPTYLPSVPALPGNPNPHRVGFIAKDFDAKGGPLLLEAFSKLREVVADAELIIVGSPPRLSKAEQQARGIRWLPLVPRDQLLGEIFPSIDVFAYPTGFDGLPLILLEAMSRGLAIAATSYRAIPEMLDYGRAGLLSPLGDATALTANLRALLDPATNRRFRAAAHERFEAKYSATTVRSQLAASYHRATEERPSTVIAERAAPPPKSPVHLGSVDGLRGIAALVIVVYHFFTNTGNPDWRPFMNINVLRPLHDGWIGVNLFLILSGFCLFWPLARDPARVFRFGSFMKRRIWRIIPAYYASLLLVPIAFGLLHQADLWNGANEGPKSPLDVVLHLSLLHSFTAESLRSWNGVTWSLGLEWTWYLFFPFAVWMFRKMGPFRAVSVLGAITVTYLVGAWVLVGPSGHLGVNEEFAIRAFLPGRLWEFGMGMFAASWIARHTLSHRCTLLALGAVPILLVIGHAATSIDPMLPVRNTIYGAAFTLVLLAVAGSEATPFQRFCESSWMQRIGEWSYSLYVFHLPVVILVTALLGRTGIGGPARFFLSLLSLPLIVLLAKWEFTAFERPFLNARQNRIELPIALPQLLPLPSGSKPLAV